MNNADRATEILRRLGSFDFDGVVEMLSPAFVQEYPYRPTPDSPTRIEGAEPFITFCRNGMSAFEPYAFRISAIYETTEPTTVIVEYSSHSRLLDTGAPYSNRYIGVLVFDGSGLLELWREYLNPQVIAEAFGA
jgi:ketosteroid isomerase-like protein